MGDRSRLTVSSDPAAAAAEVLRRRCAASISERGRFGLCLSGGGTPRGLYRMLAAVPSWIDWPRTTVFLGDERPVPPYHPDSNWGMIDRELLARLPTRPDAHRPAAEAGDIEAAAADYARLMAEAMGAPPGGVPVFDVVLLGVGTDGHIASLFPGTAALDVRDKWYVVNYVPSRGAVRLTITFPVIEAARDVMVLVSGASKSRVLASVLDERDDTLPATRLAALPRVSWFVDEAAARALR